MCSPLSENLGNTGNIFAFFCFQCVLKILLHPAIKWFGRPGYFELKIYSPEVDGGSLSTS